jgi:hypothetical protein
MNYDTTPRKMKIHNISSLTKFEGGIPAGYDLVVYERGQSAEDGLILYGFDEAEIWGDDFKCPQYAFLLQEDE